MDSDDDNFPSGNSDNDESNIESDVGVFVQARA